MKKEDAKGKHIEIGQRAKQEDAEIHWGDETGVCKATVRMVVAMGQRKR